MRDVSSRRRHVLLAVAAPTRPSVSAAVSRCPGLEVVRACDDVADLRAAAAAGLGDIAILDGGLVGLGRSVVAGLRESGVMTLGLSSDEAEHARLMRLGLDVVVRADVADDRIAERLAELIEIGRAATGPASSPPGGAASVTADVGIGPQALEQGGASVDLGEHPDREAFDAQSWREVSPEDLERWLDPRPGTVVAIWGPAGAPGRTTTAVALADLAARQGLGVLLVDADPYGGTVAAHLGLLDEAPGLVRAVAQADAGLLEAADLLGLGHAVRPNFTVLTGVPTARRWMQLRPAGLQAVLDVAREVVDLVVVDTGFTVEDDEELSYDTFAPRRNGATLVALRAADRIAVVGQAGPVGLPRLTEAMSSLVDLGVRSVDETVVVVNRVRPSLSGADPARRIAGDLRRLAPGIDLARVRFVRDDPAILDAALQQGRSLAGHAPDSAVTRELADVLGALRLPRARHTPWVGR